jgi:hypothetical protein
MKQFPCSFVVALVALAVSADCRADYMNWSYTLGLNNGPTYTSGSSVVSFALNPAKTPGAATIAVGNLSTNSSSLSTDSFSAPYNLGLTLTDNATNASGTLMFHGTLAGNLGPTTSTLTNVISDPAERLTLSGHVYAVSLPGTTPISAPDKVPTALSAQVQVLVSGAPPVPVPRPQQVVRSEQVVGSEQVVHQNPEPSGLLLAGLGLSLCSVARRRRRGAFSPAR